MSQDDSSMMIYTTSTTILILFIYVDDIIINENDTCVIQDIIVKPNSTFALKVLRDLSFFLSMEVTRKHDSFHLCQQNIFNN